MTPSNGRLDLSKAPFAELYPRLTFYYGLSPSELAAMPRSVLRLYAEALPGLLAEQQLSFMTAAIYPHLKEDSARQLRTDVLNVIEGKYRDPGMEAVASSTSEGAIYQSVEAFAHAAASAGVGVVFETPEPQGEEVTDA